MAEEKSKQVNIMDYLVSKDGKTKYLKLNDNPKADAATKKLIADLRKVLGGDVLYVNLMDAEFKAKYNIPDFVKGRVSVPAPGSTAAPTSGGVEF